MSYSLYLVHQPLLEVGGTVLTDSAHLSPTMVFLTLVALIPVVVLIARVLFVTVERRTISARPARGAVVVLDRPLAAPERGRLMSDGSAAVATAPAVAAPSEASARSQLSRNFSVLATSQAVTWASSVAWTFIIPRLLGAKEMGFIVTASAVTGILGVLLGGGLKTFLVREIVAQPDEAPRLVGTAFILRLALLPVFGAAAVLWAQVAGYGGEETMVLYIATGGLSALLAEPAQAAFQAKERMEYLAYHSVVDEVVQSFFGIGLAFLGVGASGLFGCSLVVAGLMLVLNVRWLRPVMAIDVRTNLRRIGR